MPIPRSPRTHRADHPLPTRRRHGGFALLITITLLAFLVLLLVSLASLTRVETQVAANNQQLAQARQHALNGLTVALGQLQKYCGPDQRVTAPANILATPATGTARWTGVWGNSQPASATSSGATLLNWLVSGNEAAAFDFSRTAPAFGRITTAATGIAKTPANALTTTGTAPAGVILVGANSAGSDAANQVIAPLVPITVPAGQLPGFASSDTTATPIGRYAFWVGDEGVKARINLVENEDRVASTDDDEQRLRYLTPARTGIEHLADAPADLAALAAATAAGTDLREQMRHALSNRQLGLVGGSASPADTFLKEHFHALTTHGHGVLADTLAGGLRTDLTAAFAPGTTASDAPAGPLWQATEDGPDWQLLRSYYQLPDLPGATGSGSSLSLPPQAQTDAGVHGLNPIVAFWQLYLEARLIPASGGYRVVLRLYPALVLWNPYNVTLQDTDYYLSYMLSEAGARVFVRLSQGTTSTSGSLPPVPSGSFAQVNSHWFLNTGVPLNLRVQSGALPPGQAFVYTLPADVVYDSGGAAAAALADNHTLTRGWHVGGGFKAIQKQSNIFAMPALASPGQYFVSLYVDRGGSSVTFPGSSGTAAWPAASATLQSDRLTVSLTQGGARLQEIRRITSYLNPTTTGLLLQPATAPSAPATYGYLGQKWALKTTTKGILKNINDGFVNTGIPWLSRYNPRAPILSRSSYDYQPVAKYFNSNPNFNYMTTDRYAPGATLTSDKLAINLSDPDTGRAFVGMSQNTWDGLNDPEVPLFDVPRDPWRVLSLGALQHANPYRVGEVWGAGYAPAYAIGNSLADPRVGLDLVRRTLPVGTAGSSAGNVVYDHSYLLNRALWDGYFFSSVPATGTIPTVLPNPRIERFRPAVNPAPSDADLRSSQRASAHLWVAGAFNVNSTSVEAWHALLTGLADVPVGATARSGESPYPRFARPLDDTAVLTAATGASLKAEAYRGYRFLTPARLHTLAQNIVAQVRLRGPFVSMADFVNRALVDPDPADSIDPRFRGALAQAIADAGLNDAFADGPNSTLPAARTGGVNMPNDAEARLIHNVKAAEHTPGWLSQADLLQALGPTLSARSDTFVIRAYGEAVNPVTLATEGRAWCEAVVQRLPDYIKPASVSSAAGDPAETAPASLQNADNRMFGRRFQITSFRWISPSDI